MPQRSLQVDTNPAIMKWTRESAGVDVDKVASRVGTSVENVRKWETGERKPTLRILKDLSVYYKRPLAVFFLPKPPYEPPLPHDFRVLPSTETKSLSKKVRLAIRVARRIQKLTAELTDELGVPIRTRINEISVNDNPEEVAREERKRIGIDLNEQFGWSRPLQAFRRWRHAVEVLNIVVYQAPMELKEVRGFSLMEGALPAIIVNSSDVVNGRIFTLFHEYAHLLLRTPGVCLPHESIFENDPQVERFCNHFAGAFLVPREALFDHTKHQKISSDNVIKQIANRFNVSRYVIWRRMLINNLVSRATYQRRLEEWEAESARRPPRKAGGGRDPARECMDRKGLQFTSLVLKARDRGVINYSDVADYLSIRLKYLDKVETLLE